MGMLNSKGLIVGLLVGLVLGSFGRYVFVSMNVDIAQIRQLEEQVTSLQN